MDGEVIAIEKTVCCSHFPRVKLGSTRGGQEAEVLGADVGFVGLLQSKAEQN